MLHNSRGRLKEGAFVAAVTLAQKFLGLSIEEVNRGVRLQGNASLEMQNILENYPKLVELLQKHCRERPAPSQELIKKWLRIDQPRSKPNKRARPLQGTWQAVAWKEDDEQYNLKLKKEVLKLVTLTFDVEELRATEALPMILARQKVTSKGSTIFGTYNMESKNTRALTLVLPNPNRGFTVPSIYQVEGDVLRICISKKGGLPDDFSVPSGSERILITFKKVK